MFASQLESELLWIGAVGCVAAHTLAWYRLTLDDGFFLPVVYIALEVADVAIYLITWSKLAVGQAIIIKRPFAHVDREVFILKPAAIDLGTNSHLQLSSNVLSRQLVPLFYIKICIFSIGAYLSALASLHRHIHTFSISFLTQLSFCHQVEVQWRNTCRNSNICIIWINHRKLVYHDSIHRSLATSRKCSDHHCPI